jgi:hypothetical protein
MNAERLIQANEILAAFSPGSCLEFGDNGMYFRWIDYKGKSNRQRWVPRIRGSDWPSIRHLPFGGTHTNATMELYRWVRGEHVRPISMWKSFSPVVRDLAAKHGWPETVPCVFCGRQVGNGIGWDHFDRKGWPVGPGCWYDAGCKGKPLIGNQPPEAPRE